MMVGEYGLTTSPVSAMKAAFYTFLSFVICGAVPLLPFLFKISDAFLWACGFSVLTFFAIGAWKSRWSSKPW